MSVADKLNTTLTFRADITDLSKAMQEVQRYIRAARSEFAEATATMRNWGTSADGISLKLSQLNKTIQAQKRGIDVLNAGYQKAVQEEGKTSRSALELKKRIDDMTASLKKNEAEEKMYKSAMADVNTILKSTGSSATSFGRDMDKLDNTIKVQEQQLEILKREYASLSTVHKRDTSDMKRLKQAIRELSSELQNNKSKMNQATDAANRLDNTANHMSDALTVATSRFTTMKGVMASLIASGIRRLITSMKDLAKATYDAGEAFEMQMSRVEAISGATADQMDALNKKAKEMGMTTKFTATEAGEALEYMAMAGWKADEMLEGLEGVMNLAAASGEELGTVSDMVTDDLTAMGLKAQDATRFADVLAATATNSNTNVAKMGATFKNVAPLAGQLGYTIEDMAVAIGLAANNGIKAEKAGTDLRSMFTRLSTNAGATKNQLGAMDILTKKLGVAFYDAAGDARPLNKVLTEAREKWKGLSKQQAVAYAKTIAGQRGMQTWLAIMRSGEIDVNQLTEAITHSSGAAKEMADTMLDNVGGNITILKSKIEGIMIKVFEKAAGSINKFINSVSKGLDSIDWDHVGREAAKFIEGFLDFMGKLLTNLPKVIDYLKTFGSAMIIAFAVSRITAMIGAIVRLFISIKTLTAGLTAARVASTALSVSMAALPIVGVIGLIAGLAGAMDIFEDSTEDSIDAMRNFSEEEQDLVDSTNESTKVMEDAIEARKESLAGIEGEYQYIEDLVDEYNDLIDENGKVKEGYEDRANTILNTVAKSMGVERDEIEKTINKNGKLQKSFNDLMIVRKAAAVQQAYQNDYNDALSNQKKNLDNLLAAEKLVATKEQEMFDARQKMRDAEANYEKVQRDNAGSNTAGSAVAISKAGAAAKEAREQYEIAINTFNDAQSTLSKLNKQHNEYNTTVKNFEALTEAVASGSTKNMETAINALTNSFKTAKSATKKELEEQYKTWEKYYNDLVKMAQNGSADITDAELEKYSKMRDNALLELGRGGDNETVRKMLTERGEALGVALPQSIAKGIESGKTDLQKAIKQIQEWEKFDKLVSGAKAQGIAVPQQLAKGIVDGKTDVKKAIAEIQKLDLKEIVNKAKRAGVEVPKKISQQVKSGKGDVQASIESLNKMIQLKDGVRNIDKDSKNVTKTTAKNINSGKGEVQKSVDNVLRINSAVDYEKYFGKQADKNVKRYADATKSSSNKSKVKKASQSVADASLNPLKNIMNQTWDSGKFFDMGYANGIRDNKDKVITEATKLGKEAHGALKKAQEEGSPSKLTFKSGVFFGQGYANGILSTKNVITNSVKTISSAALQTLQGTSTYLLNSLTSGRSLVDIVIGDTTTLVDFVNNKLPQLFETLASATGGNYDKIGDSAKSIFSTDISDKIDYTIDKVKYLNEIEQERYQDAINNQKAQAQSEKNYWSNWYNSEKNSVSESYKKQIESIEKERDSIVKKLEKQRDKTTNSTKKKQLKEEIANVKAQYKQIIAERKQMQTDELNNLKKQYDNRIDALNGYTESVIDDIEKEKDAYKDASDRFLDGMGDALKDYSDKAKELLSSAVDGITSKYQSLYNDLEKKQDTLINKLKTADKLFTVSSANVLRPADIQKQTQEIRDYASKLAQVKGKVSSELFEDIASYDVKEGSAFLSWLLSQSDAQIQAYDAAYSEKMRVSEEIANSVYKSDFDKLGQAYQTEISQAFEQLRPQLERIGEQCFSGLADGIASQNDYVVGTVRTIIDDMLSTFRSLLDIHSPSRVMKEIGMYTGEGFVLGLDSVKGNLENTVANLTNIARSGVDQAYSMLYDSYNTVDQMRRLNDESNAMASNIINNYNLVQNNNSPKSLSALETYKARKAQINLLQAYF